MAVVPNGAVALQKEDRTLLAAGAIDSAVAGAAGLAGLRWGRSSHWGILQSEEASTAVVQLDSKVVGITFDVVAVAVERDTVAGMG